jgi:GST-like protein
MTWPREYNMQVAYNARFLTVLVQNAASAESIVEFIIVRRQLLIDLYTWSTPNGRKVSIMLEEIAIPYTVIPVDINNNEQFNPDFLKISPNNRIPAIVDHDNGLSMMESGAILLYLSEKTGKFMPGDFEKKWQAMEWLMFQMGGLGPFLGQVHHFVKFNKGLSEYAEKRYSAEARRLYAVMDERLRNHEYLAGEYSVADIASWPWISRFEWQEIDMNEYPDVKRWYLDIAARPAVQRGYHIPHPQSGIPVP